VELTSHRTLQTIATPRPEEDPILTSEIIDLRRFASREIKPLLDIESREWDANLRWNYASAARLISAGVEEKRLSGYALLTAGRMSGYSFFFYEDAKGLIGNLYVQPGGSRLQSAQTLLEHILETLLATPGIARVETQLPHFSLEELGAQFRSQGFSAFLRRFMAVPLPGRTPRPPDFDPEKAAKREILQDVEIVPWERRHDHQAARLLFEVYRNHVDAKINDHYKSLQGSTRLVENIVRHWGCGENLPGASLVAIRRPTQKIVANLAVTAVRSRTAHIPQIAVAPEFQGRGLGTAMMELSFRRLARQGYKEVTLTVTDRNFDAVRLYERLGFETFRTFGAFVWERT
jgi:ribosomal protein S18 acetylase RimI-like enzyme